MPLHCVAKLICDDVRQEVGNKLSAMGIYAGLIGFPPGDGPFALPKIAGVFIVGGMANLPEVKFRQVVTIDPPLQLGGFLQVPQHATQPMKIMARPDPTQDEHYFAQVLSPAVFQAQGSLTFALDLEVEGELYRFEHRIRVVRGATDTAPLAPPN